MMIDSQIREKVRDLAEIAHQPGWWAPLRLEHLAAHCPSAGIMASASGTTLVQQLAARTPKNAAGVC